jgi:peptide/nickel transport system ATP-binding protein
MNGPRARASDDLLDVAGVSKTFTLSAGMFRKRRRLRAVDNVSVRIRPGEVLAIVGESGCGKTTLMRMLIGLMRPDNGMISVAGQDIERLNRREIARWIQPVFQDPFSSLNPRKTLGQILEAPLRIHDLGSSSERRKMAIESLGHCGLASRFIDKYPNQLSGGQRQRVAIARALIIKPQLLICDEPTSALDVSVQSQILNLLAELRETFGLTYMMISHNLAVVEYIATRVLVMYLGRVVEEGPTRKVFSAPRHPYTRALLSAVLTPEPGLGLPDPGLRGQFPNAISPPSGCHFHPRCCHAMAICRTVAPPLKNGVTCHLDDAVRADMPANNA